MNRKEKKEKLKSKKATCNNAIYGNSRNLHDFFKTWFLELI